MEGKMRRKKKKNEERNGKQYQRRHVEELRGGSSGSETISRPVEISEKLISIQTDTVGCGGWGLRWGWMNIYQKMSSNGLHIDTPKGCGKREETGDRNSGTELQKRKETERQRQARERTGKRGTDTEWRVEPGAGLREHIRRLHPATTTPLGEEIQALTMSHSTANACVCLLLSPCPGMFC